MIELQDSHDILNHPPELRHRMMKDGYLFLRGLLDRSEIRSVGEQIASQLQAVGFLSCGTPSVKAIPRGQAPASSDLSYRNVYAMLQRIEAVHRLPYTPSLLHMMSILVSKDVFVLPQKIIRTVWPAALGGQANPNIHRDYPTWRIPDMFTTWIPFSDCPVRNGGLAILVGSHCTSLDDQSVFDEGSPSWATTDYKAGDVLVFHCFTVHATLTNITDRLRFSGDYRWQSASVPVPEWALEPDGEQRDWSALTNEWDTVRWLDVPGNLVVSDPEEKWEELDQLPASRFILRRNQI